MFGLFKRKRKVSLEDQLAAVARGGIRLRPGITIERLLADFDRQEFEAEPYTLLLITMGQGMAPLERLSDSIWHLDTECIDGPGDYARIAERMRDLAGPVLPLTDIVDHVDIDARKAWVEFTHEGKRVHWDASVQDDWLDETIMSRFAGLLKEWPPGKRFTYLDLEGQDCHIGCCTRDQLQEVNNATGLKFVWLT